MLMQLASKEIPHMWQYPLLDNEEKSRGKKGNHQVCVISKYYKNIQKGWKNEQFSWLFCGPHAIFSTFNSNKKFCQQKMEKNPFLEEGSLMQGKVCSKIFLRQIFLKLHPRKLRHPHVGKLCLAFQSCQSSALIFCILYGPDNR